MKKTILSVLAALLTLTLLLAGCSTPGDSQQKETTSAVTQESQGSEYNELGTFPITNTRKEFSILAPWLINEPITENETVIEYEKMTNVHINWQTTPADGWMA